MDKQFTPKNRPLTPTFAKSIAGAALGLALGSTLAHAADTWVQAVTASAPKYWYRFDETDPGAPAVNAGSTAPAWDGVFGSEITSADNLGKPSIVANMGTALEFTGPAANSGTGKYVDLAVNGLDAGGNPVDVNVGIPELTNFRPPAVDKTTTVEYWIKTTQTGSTANQTWTSPALLARESPGDGDMYWGWFNSGGNFGFSTSDITEIYAGQANKIVNDGRWHHIVLVKEWHVAADSPSRMYIDGGGTVAGGVTIVRNTGAGSASYQDTDSGIRYLGFVQSGGGGDVQYIGTIDELAIYDRGLSETEVAAHYNSVATVDTDGDGIPDLYEIGHGLNPNVADANADPDNDGLSNMVEYQRGTDPLNPDTDGDGLKDSVETKTGVYVSATDTGTDPLIADTDNDGLLDGVETNTGVFVNASNTGTNPHLYDTDGDTFEDGGEVRVGSNPLDRNSVPSRPGNWSITMAQSTPKYWWRFDETDPAGGAANSGSAVGWDGVFGSEITSANLGRPSALPGLGTALEFTGPRAPVTTQKFVDLAVNGLDADGNQVDPALGIPELTNFRPPKADKTTTVEYWIRTTQRGSAANQTWTSPALLARESGGDGDMYWGWFNADGDFGFSTSDITEIYANRDSGRNVTDGQWHHIVLVKEWHAKRDCRSTMYLDGGTPQGGATITRTTGAGDPSYQDTDGGIRYLGFTQNGGGSDLQFIGLIDELAVYDRALTPTEVRQHYRSVYEADTDGDGMPDAYEISNNLNPLVNDANLDADNDGLTNIQEYRRGTNPQNPDTDGDGALDGVETDTGVWVSANDRGTDPFNPDTDGDGLLDGVETNTGVFQNAGNTGTNPLLTDSDGDLYRDGDEVALGSNPTSSASKPNVPPDFPTAVQADTPLYWWRFDKTAVADGVPNEGSAAGFDGTFGGGILDTDLGKPSAAASLGTALELTGGPAPNTTDKFVDFGDVIPELINPRPAPVDGKATTVEYWIKTTQRGSTGNQTWTSPSIFARESGGDGDMYWGWITQDGRFGFSTSDITEIYANGVTDGNWHHVVMSKIWRQSVPCTSRMYIDGGVLSGGQSFVVNTGAGTTSQQDDDGAIRYLGFTQNGGGADVQFIGQIDEVAIYDKAFNEGQARIHYLASRAPVPPRFIRISVAPSVPPRFNVTLTFRATLGASYTVQGTVSLPGGWTTIGQTPPAQEDVVTFVDRDRPPLPPTAFYRLIRN